MIPIAKKSSVFRDVGSVNYISESLQLEGRFKWSNFCDFGLHLSAWPYKKTYFGLDKFCILIDYGGNQMIPFPDIDPEIFRIGNFAIRWYGLMYLIGFAASYLLVRYQVRKKKLPLKFEDIESLYSWLVFGLLLGARLGYVLFYDLASYIRNPFEIVAVWHGGMSFHGGLAGAVIAGLIFARKKRLDFWLLSDLVVVTAPIGIGLGRLGNFINGELYGRVTDVPWGMVFPGGGPLPRHPSQLYEFMLEGILLFVILWFILRPRKLTSGTVTASFLILYGSFRTFIEFFREPDPQIGLLAGFFTMGQLLSIAMIMAGVGILFYKRK
jgi:phosphatidylglycerol---prolipoprotein diacylglyceryl transferase